MLNLYAVEGYSHKEIAEMLDIEESTSRSQYTRARQMLEDILVKKKIIQKPKEKISWLGMTAGTVIIMKYLNCYCANQSFGKHIPVQTPTIMERGYYNDEFEELIKQKS